MSSWIFWNIFVTSFPLCKTVTCVHSVSDMDLRKCFRCDGSSCTSENHLEKRLWLLISTNWLCEYLKKREKNNVDVRRTISNCLFDLWKMSHLPDSLMESFWASPLHRDVFPVPGGPEGLWEIRQLYKHGMGSRSMKTEFAKLANKLLLSYHEATRHDSRQLNCCRHFCQRRKLLSKHNPRAGDQSEDKDHVMGCQQIGMGGMKTQQ